MLAVDIDSSSVRARFEGMRKLDLRAQALLTALKALLRATRAIESSYRKATWCTNASRSAPLRMLFERHQAEQRELGHVLVGRMSLMAGMPSSVSSHDAYETQFRAALRRGASPVGLLQGLEEHHGWVLRAAAPSTRLCGGITDWARDFAVGRVVLTNDLQRAALVEELRYRDPQSRFLLDCHSGEM